MHSQANPRAQELASVAAPAVFRTSLDQPGFSHFDLGVAFTPRTFRALLITVGQFLTTLYEERFGARLQFVSISRFDQQSPTRPHRDGGPDASVLLLGYEPTEVHSRLFLMDYVRAARDHHLTPQEYLDQANPAFGGDERLLHAYTTEVRHFQYTSYQIVIINNSCLPLTEGSRGMLGVLHHAQIATPRPDRTRPISSVLLGITTDGLDAEALSAFVTSAQSATR
jgi:hypothetical protein